MKRAQRPRRARARMYDLRVLEHRGAREGSTTGHGQRRPRNFQSESSSMASPEVDASEVDADALLAEMLGDKAAEEDDVLSREMKRQRRQERFMQYSKKARLTAPDEESLEPPTRAAEGGREDSGAQNSLETTKTETAEGGGEEQKKEASAPVVFDMFAEDDNIPMLAKSSLDGEVVDGLDRGEGGALQDNWDDAEGYYTFRVNEVLNGRYQVINCLGRGVFSSVLRAYDRRLNNDIVAIKVIRAHDIMYKAGMKEMQILRELTGDDLAGRHHCIRFLDHFEYREHLCIVMEAMHLNLRKLVKKYGKGEGISLRAVRSYAKQVFVALRHIARFGIVHADLKPDNMVVNEELNVLKICDFGSAYRNDELPELDLTPYVVSRYYRAPEIVLGYGPKSAAMDVWAAAVSVAEMFTGKLLFAGRDNNGLLKSIMDLCGKVPKRLLSRSNFREDHFDERGAFLSREIDRVTGGEIVRTYANVAPTRDLLLELSSSLKPNMAERLRPELGQFKDFLEKCLNLDPARRITAEQALSHPFVKGV